MKKFIQYLIPVVTLLLFVVIMLSGEYLKKPRNPSEDVIGFAKKAITHVSYENWYETNKDLDNLENAWKKISPRIQFGVEINEVYNINMNIAKIKGSILVKDKSSTLSLLYEIMNNWGELTK